MDRIKRLAAISAYRPGGGQLLHLFEMLNGGMNREEAKIQFNEEGASDEHFNVLYSNLTGRLMEGILINSFKDCSLFRRRYFKLLKAFTACKMMIHSGDKMNGVPEAEKVVRKAIALKMPELALPLARELEMHFSVTDTVTKKYHKYKELSIYLQSEVNKETEAQRLYASLAFAIKRRLSMDEFKNRIKALLSTEPSDNFLYNFYLFSTRVLYHWQTDDKISVLKVCQEAFDFFYKFESPIPHTVRWNFAFQMIPILVGKKDFGKAEVMTKRCVQMVTEGSYNYHASLIYLALVGFHSGKPAIALEAWKLAQSTPKKFKSKEIDERWQLIRSYLELYGMDIPGEFRLYRFLNSIPTLNADKSRNNVAVIISHLLHLWKDGKTDTFGDQVKQLRSYINRHLRKPGYERPRWFLMMLEKFYESQYHPRRYEPRVKTLWRKIQSTSPNINANVFSTEVIPIEKAWAMVVGE
ncbi:MAG: hypothetical protein AAFZ15_34805 [Bacteroidota bacterium]